MSMRISVQDAWAAGVVNVLGSFFSNTHQRASFSIKTSMYRQAVDRLAVILGVEVHTTVYRGKILSRLTITGDPLDEAMQRLWPGLMPERRAEYEFAVAQAKEQREAVASLRAHASRPAK